MAKVFNKVLVSELQRACRATASASAEIARCALTLIAASNDADDTSKDVAMLMRDAVADIPGKSMGVYVSQMRRIAAQGVDKVRDIVRDRERCATWIGFESIINAYDIPSTGSKRGVKGAKADAKADTKADAAPRLETLPELLVAFVAIRASAPKVSANMEALTLMDQAIALLRQEAQRAAQAAKAKA